LTKRYLTEFRSLIYFQLYEKHKTELGDTLIGRGEFCNVFPVHQISLDDHLPRLTALNDKERRQREAIARECAGNTERYVIKQMRQDVHNFGMKRGIERLIYVLQKETHMLRRIDHPNIITLRAVGESDPIDESYFIVLDRLEYTLQDKIYEKWHSIYQYAMKKKGSIKNILSFGRTYKKYGKSYKEELRSERLKDMIDLANALSYLHRNRMIYRDIKPENVGFTSRGELKLFDFGLSRDLPKMAMCGFDQYMMTGRTGSRRYMAPEVTLRRPYGISADVYAFGILMWEMMCLRRPFIGMTVDEHEVLVAANGLRPSLGEDMIVKDFKIRKSSPFEKTPSECSDLVTLMAQCWDDDLRRRPSMTNVHHRLRLALGTKVVRRSSLKTELIDEEESMSTY